MRLGLKDRCPIHRRTDCCGRQGKKKSVYKSKWEKIGDGVYKILDPFHPRGYRIRRSKSAMKRLVLKKLDKDKLCCICREPFTDMADVTPEHFEPRGMGAGRRDDHEDNIGAAHSWCNSEKGSKRMVIR